MDPLFSRMLKRHTPEFNPDVMRGLAVKEMAFLEEKIDEQIRSICVGLPSSVRYVGYRRCTPREEFLEVTKDHNNKRNFNLAKNSVYLVKYFFVFTDELGHEHNLCKHIYLISVKEGGLFHISGTEMHLIPVISDKVFTPSSDSIFVRLVQDRNNFFRMYHTVVIDNMRVSEYVAHSEIYRNPSKAKPGQPREATTKAKTTLIHYLFARYGFTGAFLRYANISPEVGKMEDFPESKYPRKDWVISHSTKSQPKTCIDKLYKKNDIVIAVKRSEWSDSVKNLIVGFFYVTDHFTNRFTHDPNILNDTALWMILIGHIRFSGDYPENKLYVSIKEHFETIEPYLDKAVRDKLSECDIRLENYFDLLWYVQINFNAMIRKNEQSGLCSYGKSLEVIQYVGHEIYCGFTMMKFKLNKIASKTGGVITKRDVADNLARTVRMGAIFGLNSGKIVSEVVGYSGDHLYPKITAILAQQESQSGNRDSEQRIVPGPKHYLDLSMITVGSILNLPKSNPTPLVRINGWITLDPKTNTILPNPKFEKLFEENKSNFRF